LLLFYHRRTKIARLIFGGQWFMLKVTLMTETGHNQPKRIASYSRECQRAGKILGYEVTRKGIETLSLMERLAKGRFVEVGKLIPVKENSVVVTYGTETCIAGVAIGQEKPFVFHSSGNTLGPEMIEAIKQAKGGLVGGNPETLKKYDELFLEKNFRRVWPEPPEDSFGVAVVRRSDLGVPPGIYYSSYKFVNPLGEKQP
jgi:hypothetical protein